MSNLDLFIEAHDHDPNLFTVYLNNRDECRAWPIFSGTINECTYFKENLIKGYKFLTSEE